ncbi:MAG TPA: hypothetical protein EYH20_06665 [Leucothrix sp.]|nr:hypothetical protein [Leucothrix sp.]
MNILSKTRWIWIAYVTLLASSTVFATNKTVHNSLAQATNIRLSNAYAFKKCRDLQGQPFDKKSKKKRVIIIGDSQGCDFLNSALENGYLRNYQIQFHFIPYPCQTVPGEYISKYIEPKHRRFCTTTGRTDTLEKVKKQVPDANLIIYASLWKTQVAEKLPKIINYLQIKKDQRLIVIGNKFFGNMLIQDYFHMSSKELRKLRNDVGTKTLEINSILQRRLGGRISFIDPHKLVCGNRSTSCPIFTNNLQLISYDGRHLTKAGARYVGKILFQKTVLGKI